MVSKRINQWPWLTRRFQWNPVQNSRFNLWTQISCRSFNYRNRWEVLHLQLLIIWNYQFNVVSKRINQLPWLTRSTKFIFQFMDSNKLQAICLDLFENLPRVIKSLRSLGFIFLLIYKESESYGKFYGGNSSGFMANFRISFYLPEMSIVASQIDYKWRVLVLSWNNNFKSQIQEIQYLQPV